VERQLCPVSFIIMPMNSQNESSDGVGERLWNSLYQETVQAGRVLTPAVYDGCFQLFLERYTMDSLTPSEQTREYTRDEFLLVVDPEGRPGLSSAEMVWHFQQAVIRYPDFAKWFQVSALPDWELDTPVLLAARWLCHLIGLRHGTVEIFLDPPDIGLFPPGAFTLVQVRGMDKVEAPGTFDLPCAGHVTGTDAPDQALRKELGEELNLALEDLDGLHLVAQFVSDSGEEPHAQNSEFRMLFRAKVKADALPHIRFTDGEVAGLAIFSVDELRELVKKFPERVASGMADSIKF
jgi:8-oxo-dGTP pyrophosphatase MutT (NUDIX family)